MHLLIYRNHNTKKHF